MMSDAEFRAKIWATLGIEPTIEAGVIRRAYAEQLRRTRPEDDRSAFEMLRWAYESARELARLGEQGEAEPEDAVPAPPRAPSPGEDGPSAWETQWARIIELQQAIGGDGRPEEIRALFEAIVTDPAMANVSVWEQIVGALTLEAARPLRAADPLVGPVLDRLGGRGAAEDWKATPAQQALLERARQIEIRRQLNDPEDRRNRAYRVLTHPRSAHGIRASVQDIRALLRMARVDEPWLMSDFDRSTVEHWNRRFRRNPSLGDPKVTRRKAVAVAVVLVGLLYFVVAASAAGTPEGDRIGMALVAYLRAIPAVVTVVYIYFRLDRSARRRQTRPTPPASAPPAGRSR